MSSQVKSSQVKSSQDEVDAREYQDLTSLNGWLCLAAGGNGQAACFVTLVLAHLLRQAACFVTLVLAHLLRRRCRLSTVGLLILFFNLS